MNDWAIIEAALVPFADPFATEAARLALSRLRTQHERERGALEDIASHPRFCPPHRIEGHFADQVRVARGALGCDPENDVLTPLDAAALSSGEPTG